MWSTNESSRFAVAALAAGLISGMALAGTNPPPNDLCTEPSTAQCGTNTGSNIDATGTSLADCGTDDIHHGHSNVWWEFVAPFSGTYYINTNGSALADALLGVFTACEGTELACDDDSGDNQNAAVSIVLSSGQHVLIEVSSWGTTGSGLITLNIECPESSVCCEPWDNGTWDHRTSQTSQIAFGQDWRLVGRVTADDFWLCEGNVYRINEIHGILLTDSVVPKADVIILDDCDGLPNNIVAAAFSIAPTDVPTSLECLLGEVSITEAGPGPDGLRQILVTANWDRLFLKGGEYWVVIYGYSGTADQDEQFFWGTTNNQVVRGRPGQFAEIDDLNHIYWTSIDEICCGCTDFNFCVLGEQCKILLDNGGPLVVRGGGATYLPGDPSLENGSSSSRVRAADNFVVPPCHAVELCYVEAWVWSNCDTIKLDIFADGCHCPTEAPPLWTFTADCVFETDLTYGAGSTQVRLKKAVFFDLETPYVALNPNQNYWLSAYGVGDGSQASRAYFCHNSYCDRECWVNFDPACSKGPPYGTSHWLSSQLLRTGGHDLAFLVAIEPETDGQTPGGGGTPPATCRTDINADGRSTLQDLFDFLAAYFSGCP